jgi:hypothetical protein
MVSRLESNQACPPKTEKTNLECGMVIERERRRRGASRPFRPVHPQEDLPGPGLVNLLRTPHLLTDPRRDKMEDLEELEVSEGGRSIGAWFGEDG